jgi:hypothetical protein
MLSGALPALCRLVSGQVFWRAVLTRSRSGSVTEGQPTTGLRRAVAGPSEAAQRRSATTTNDSRSRQ